MPRSVPRSLAVLAACLLTAGGQRPVLDFRVDPRIELLAAVQLLSGYEERTNLITNHDFPYKDAMASYFAAHRDHAAVALFDTLSREGFSFDAPVGTVLHLSPPPELEPLAPMPEMLERRAGGVEQLQRFVAALRDFARASEFERFYAEHGPFYRRIEEAAASAAEGEEWIATLESYYGTSQHGYHVVLAPIFEGNFGPRVERGEGRYDLYGVVSPRGVEDGLPVFGSTASFRHLALHEFGHSFVNPITTQYREQLMGFASLLEPIRERMRSQAYGEWETVAAEHVLRAVTTRMVYRREGEEAGSRVLKREQDRGFVYVPALVAKLEKYEANRDRYPAFVDFYAELLAVFDSLSQIDGGTPQEEVGGGPV